MNFVGISPLPGLLLEESAPAPGEWLIDVYKLLGTTMEQPQPYGLYHILCLSAIIALTVLLSYRFRDASPEIMRRVLLIFWVIMVSYELVEQIWASTDLVNGSLVFNYRWPLFPFQVCATGMWILPLIIHAREGRVKDAMMMYMGLYSLFGGVLVCLVPTTVFTPHVITNIHTLVQHGSQIIVGVTILVNYRKKLNFRRFLSAIPVFLVCAGIAVGLNELFYHLAMAFGGDYYEVNMFYFSHRFNNNMPIIGTLYELMPWWLFFVLYILAFVFITFIIYFIAILSIHIAVSIRERRRASVDAAAPDAAVECL